MRLCPLFLNRILDAIERDLDQCCAGGDPSRGLGDRTAEIVLQPTDDLISTLVDPGSDGPGVPTRQLTCRTQASPRPPAATARSSGMHAGPISMCMSMECSAGASRAFEWHVGSAAARVPHGLGRPIAGGMGQAMRSI
jgi:hypothetical protein